MQARSTLYQVLLTIFKLFAAILLYITEKNLQGLFAETEGTASIHTSHWPVYDETLADDTAEAAGEILMGIGTAVRRYKTERGLRFGPEL
jgi:valyl-tRNA synthetase